MQGSGRRYRKVVVFLRRLLAVIRTSALGEAWSNASWSPAADKASVVESPGENGISPALLAGVLPNALDRFNTAAFMSTLCSLSRMNNCEKL